MKTEFRVLCSVVAAVLYSNAAYGHDPIVHIKMSEYAEAYVYNHSFSYADFISTISYDCSRKVAVESMKNGSRMEDKESVPRCLNHFYDPLTGLGLSNIPLDDRLRDGTTGQVIPIGNDSFTWASTRDCPGLYRDIWIDGIHLDVRTYNFWSWQNARAYEWFALTSANPGERGTNFDHAFRAVGQVMHLLQDTSQPQHVRNEQHLAGSCIEDYGLKHTNDLAYQDSMLDWRRAGFTKMEDFWNRHLYAPGNATALENAENGGTQLGLAEWCNGNFLGARHLFPEYFKPGDVECYPFPSRDHSTDYSDVKSHPANHVETYTDEDEAVVKGIYLKKTGDGVKFDHLARVNFLGAKIHGLTGKRYCTIYDPNVLTDYHDNFIPKAVEYSAGILDYFFRGTLGASVAGDGLGNYTITVQNKSGQDFGGGSLYLFQDDTNGNRTLIQQTDLSNTLWPNLGTTDMTFIGSGTNKCILVYQGTIGVTSGTNALDPVDAGIGIAAASVTFSTNGIIYPEEPVRWYLAIVGDNCGGVPWMERLVSTSSSFNGNNGDYTAPIYFINQYICGFWCALPVRGVAYDVTVNFNDEAYECVWDYWSGMLQSGDVYHVDADQSEWLWFGSPNGFNSVGANLVFNP